MLFNAYDFLFGLLPVALIGHRVAMRRGGSRAAMGWLVAVSLFFYAWWYPPYLLLLLGSIAVNFQLGRWLGDDSVAERTRNTVLVGGIVANLSLLGWFKYANFFADNLSGLGLDLQLPAIALPLAISFFTFQQVAYLVDAHRGLTRSYDPLDYALFVSFFPQLVAGPIVHHGEVMPQFATGEAPTDHDRAVGGTQFLVGLFKKVIIADAIAGTTDAVFYATAQGLEPTLFQAWTGVLAYHFQLYFDFSGYSDMAIGLARLFGIKLPANFDAPYRANDIADFWRRWHQTLSRFLRDYVYIPLGGNRLGRPRLLFNLFATMFLGGLWHGAGWTYVIWGGLHGVYLVIHFLWRETTGGFSKRWWGVAAARTITWVALLCGWCLFRGEDLDDAWRLFRAMWGLSPEGIGLPDPFLLIAFTGLLWFTQTAPTTQRWMEDHEPVLQMQGDEVRWSPGWMWQPTTFWAVVVGIMGFACVPVLERADAFLYWNF